MFSIARARSSMIFEARNSSRRWTIVTFEANLARKIASSIAVSPPPTMIVVALLEERGVARGAVGHAGAAELLLAGHAELLVLGAHRQDDGAGLVLVVADPDPVDAAGLVGELDPVAWSVMKRAPKRSAWSRNFCISSGPMIPVGEAGVVLDVGRLLEQAAPDEALDDERLEVRARRVQRGRVAGRAAADDDHVLDVRHWFTLAFSAHFTLYSSSPGVIVTPRPTAAWLAAVLVAPARRRSGAAGSRRPRPGSSAARTTKRR